MFGDISQPSIRDGLDNAGFVSQRIYCFPAQIILKTKK